MRLVFRPEDEAELVEIYDHIAEDSPVRAEKFVTLIRSKCEPLR